MRELAQQGVVSRIGISVYTGAQIDRALELFEPDIIQLPINLFDQRLLQSGHLRQLKSRGIEVHARSVFLQGLLFMDPEQLGGSFSPARPHFEHYRTFLRQHRLTPLQAALQFVSQLSELDAILVGVTALSDLREVVEVHRTLSARPALDMSCLAFQDERILNPAFWSTVS
jgi:aryl-alcohol dehydrogenase-like predicted oxidoreductase